MGYVVTAYHTVPGTTSQRKFHETRPTRLDSAVRHAEDVTLRTPGHVATVAATGPHGRTLLGTATLGKFKPARAYDQHTRTGDPMPAATKPKPKAPPEPKYTAHVWSIDGGKVVKAHRLKSETGIVKWANEASTKPNVREVTVTDPKGQRVGVARRGSWEAKSSAAVETMAAIKKPATAKPKVTKANANASMQATVEKAAAAAKPKPAQPKPAAEPAPAGPIVWTALPATNNGDRRIVGARGRAVTRVYTGGNAEKAQACIDAIVALPALVAAAREIVDAKAPNAKLVAALRSALASIPDHETLASLG